VINSSREATRLWQVIGARPRNISQLKNSTGQANLFDSSINKKDGLCGVRLTISNPSTKQKSATAWRLSPFGNQQT
jgi:hypothetical protein